VASIALIAADTGHASATNTETALTNKGHTVTKIAEGNIGSTDFSEYDCIVAVRLTSSAGVAAALRSVIDGGKPALLGTMWSGATGGTTNQPGPTSRMHLSGNFEVWSSVGINGMEIVDVTHEITDGFDLGDVFTTAADSYWVVIDTGTYLGTLLADGESGVAFVADQPETWAIEVGTEDQDTPAVEVGARVVCAGCVYGGQGVYSSDGEAFLDACIAWLTAGGGGTKPGRRSMSMAMSM